MPRVAKSCEKIVDEKQFYRLKRSVREYIRDLPDDGVNLSEKEIAERFRLTRGTSRKMLICLEAEGVVRSVPYLGYRKVDYSGTTVHTHFLVRRCLEGEAARLAAVRADRADILRLELILDEMQRAMTPEFSEKLSRLDREFHMAIVEASHDNLLKNLCTMLDASIPAWLGLDLKVDYSILNERALAAHRGIFEAIRGGSSDEASALMLKHLPLPDNDNIPVG